VSGSDGNVTAGADRQTDITGARIGTAVFAWEWAREVVGTSWVPDDRTVVAERLRLLTAHAVDALLAEVFPVAAGHEIGAGLVAAGFVAPEALGRTLYLLSSRLLGDTGLDADDARLRANLAELLGAVGVGFSRAARERTLAEQDAIRHSELVARQRLDRTPWPSAGAGPAAELVEPAGAALAADLPAAVERGELVAQYQPIVRLADNAVVGVEALPRWRHPDRGTVLRRDLLDAAERAGELIPVARRLRAEACAAALSWYRPHAGPLFLSLPLHPAELDTPAIADDIVAVLDRTGLPPTLLQLVIPRPGAAIDVDTRPLRALTTAGIRLALDGFGTNPVDVATLPELPITELRLAAGVLRRLRHPDFRAAQAAAQTVDALNAFADRLGLTTVAGGISTAGEADLLNRLHTTHGQGSYYGQPTTAADTRTFLTATR
jgi:EAL domain-containing protein (putative c-di-GMP-specific phosphodiesterase class I)